MMKNSRLVAVLVSLIIIFSSLLSDAQNYLINAYNNNVISNCSGNFYDSGGSSGGYSGAETYVVTFCPPTPGQAVNLDFTSFSVDPGDALEIFDSPTIYGNSLGVFTTFVSPVNTNIQASINNSTGCLTVKWTSVNGSSNSGWHANLSCNIPCQPFEATLQSSTPAFTLDSGIYYIDICPDDTISLTATGNYSFNNTVYNQSDNTSTFSWDFGNGVTKTGQNTDIFYDTISGFLIDLTMVDSIGCDNASASDIRVRISTVPDFNGTLVSNHIMCARDTLNLSGSWNPTLWETVASLNSAGQTYLPDGSGVSYTSDLTFTSFGVGQVLQTVSDINSICATIEHSYLGDLDIDISCPNGQSVTLKSYPGGTSTFMGEPIDNNAAQIPGIGYEYCWMSTGTTTMLAAAGSYTYSYTNAQGATVSNHSYLPPSNGYPANATATVQTQTLDYLPEQSFNNLVGCPLNGTWTITVTDNLSVDNGYIFNWGIDFNPNILPASWSYIPNDSINQWDPTNTIVGNNGQNAVSVPDTAGNYNYTYTVIDNHNCAYDTTINVHVKQLPNIDLGNDTIICDGQYVIDATTTASASYLWHDMSTQNTYQVDSTEVVWVQVSDSACVNSDTLLVEVSNGPSFTTKNDSTCEGQIAKLEVTNDSTYTYLWSSGATTYYTIVNPTSSKYYTVEVFDSIGCSQSDSVLAYIVPAPDLQLVNDQVICNGEQVQLSANGANNFLWSTGDTTSKITVSPNATKVYSVIASNADCSDTADVEVYVVDYPDGEIISESDTICLGAETTLTATGGTNYLWENGSNSAVLNINPNGTNEHTVFISNEYNGKVCGEFYSHVLFVERCNKIFTPNAFSPDGDGKNDLFAPQGDFTYVEYINLQVFDRYGRLVYETRDLSEGWDGRIDGVEAPNGVYTYVLKIKEMKLDEYIKAGTVTLIR